MLSNVDKYEALYVISDLHLGGYTGSDGCDPPRERDYRIFVETDALKWLINEVGRRAKEDHHGPVALVLNGDVVDFLAVKDAKCFSAENAVHNITSIVKDPQQGPVWEALRAFVSSGAGDLVIVLGNHDVELALPQVHQYLTEYLTGGQRGRRANLIFATDGAGFRCDVGKGRVLCIHGNRTDPWNVVDYPQLVHICRALTHDTELPEWNTNAGTTLVVDVMNAFKKRWQWIDLLKPEQETAVMILVAINKDLKPKLKAIGKIAARAGRDAAKMSAGFLSGPHAEEGAEGGEAINADEHRFLAALDRASAGDAAAESEDAEDAILAARMHLAGQPGAATMEEAAVDEEMLGAREIFSMIFNMAKLAFSPRSLRKVLKENLLDDTSFAPLAADDTFEKLDEAIGPGIDFLIAGHTHHDKALKRNQATGYYYNSGTWIQLMRLPEEALEEDVFEEKVLPVLEDGAMAELAEPIDLGGGESVELVCTRRSVVCIQQTSTGAASGELLRVEDSEGSGFALKAVKDTAFSIS